MNKTNMSHKSTDQYNEYIAELECPLCQNNIWISVENREDIDGQGAEWDVEEGHSEECRYFKTTDRIKADKDATTPKPVFKNIWTAEEERERKKYLADEFLRMKGYK